MKRIIYSFITLFFLFTFSQQTFAQEAAIKVPFGAMNARSIGPAVMSGRITTLDAAVKDPQILYIGAANGGLGWNGRTLG